MTDAASTAPARAAGSMPPDYFESLYARDPDPWRFETSAYEHAKYDATLDALPRPRFARGFEAGCANGVLTRRLAARCDALLAVDVAEAALAQARARCADLPQVEIRRMRTPHEWPSPAAFDLIVLSEVLYYLSGDDLALCACRAAASLAEGGAALLVHYVLPTDYPLSGDAAADGFIRHSGLRPALRRREAAYRLDLLLR